MGQRLSERLRSGCLIAAKLLPSDSWHWLALVHDGLLPDAARLSLLEAFTVLSIAVQRESATGQRL